MGEVAHLLWPGGFGFTSGTSVGAINASGIAMFNRADFKEATAYTVTMWTEHVQKTSDIWSLRFPLGIPGLWNPSVGTNDALRVLLDKVVDIKKIQDSDVTVRYASVDMISGELVVHDEADLALHGVAPIMSSASYPLAFPPVQIGDHWLSDGGLRDTAPVGAALEFGCDDIVILTTRDPYQSEPKPKDEMGNVFNFGVRCLSLMFHEGVATDVKLAELYNRLAGLEDILRTEGVEESVIENIIARMKTQNIRKVGLTVLYPSKPLGPSLDFSAKQMLPQIEQGYADAKAQLAHLLPGTP